jgi:hypothetical protein
MSNVRLQKVRLAPASFASIALATSCIALAAPVSRLEPSSFTAVPAAVRVGLARQGCTVPQTYLTRKPQNVVRGSFTRPKAKEWAALCSVGGASEILVFSMASSQPLARFAKAQDENFIQTVAPGRSGFSRQLRAVPSSVRGLSGVEDAFVEKASTVWVYERCQWQEKPGTD